MEDSTIIPPPPDLEPGEPLSFDWRNVNGVNYLSEIKDQLDCGSCYAFASTAVAEAVYYRETNQRIDLSEAFIAFNGQCSYPTRIYGCGGLWDFINYPCTAVRMYCQEGGILEDNYEYHPVQQQCSEANFSYPRYRFHSFGLISSGDISEIKQKLREYGPLLTAGVPAFWDSWIPSDTTALIISTDYDCYDAEGFPHAVCIVGYGYEGGPGGAGDYWIIRNSMGSSWGNGGYINIRATDCKLSCFVSYLTYKEPYLSGPYLVKGNGYNIYNMINEQQSVESYSWSVSPTSLFSGPTSGSSKSFQLYPATGQSGPAILTFINHFAVGYDPDPTATFTMNLWVGPPLEPIITCLTSDPCASPKTYRVQERGVSGANEIIWTKSGSLTIVSHDDNECTVSIGYPGGTLYCENSNTNGSTYDSYVISFECPTMTVSPNPANDEVLLNVENIEEGSQIDIDVFNSTGIKKISKRTNNTLYKLRISELDRGVYYLKVRVKSKDGNTTILENHLVISR